MLKKLFLAVLVSIAFADLSAQTSGVVKWQFSARKISDLVYEIHLTPTAYLQPAQPGRRRSADPFPICQESDGHP
jgi:hypothetical protein